jgi:hypothetical protein
MHLINPIVTPESQSFSSELWVTFEIWQDYCPDGRICDQLVMVLMQSK